MPVFPASSRLARASGCALLLAVALPACSGTREDVARAIDGWAGHAGWVSGVAVSLGEKLGGCAVGDVDPALPGDEIVVVGISGRIWLVSSPDGRWAAQVIGQAAGEMIQVAVGDVDPRAPGAEVVAVGMAAGTEDDGGEGAAHLLRRTNGGWAMEELCRSPALLHAVTTVDVDDRPGEEIVVAGFARRVVLLAAADTGWSATELAEVDGAVKSLLPFQGGVAAACADGALVLVEPAGDGTWSARLIDQALAGLARLGTDGQRLLAARDDGILQLLTDVQGTGEAAAAPPAADAVLAASTEIHRESGKLRGAVIANLDSTIPGLELATAGYGRRVTVLAWQDGAFRPHEVWLDDDRLHHLAAGQLGATGGSIALVACGFSGQVVVMTRRP